MFVAYLKPYLNHQFQNVRERLGSMLINIFECDISFPNRNIPPECPRIETFIDEITEKFHILYDDFPRIDLSGKHIKANKKFAFVIRL